MDSIKEVFVSISDSLRDRLGNPLVGAFVIAWSVWNFRMVLILIGDGDGGWHEKISYIDTRLMISTWDWLLHGLVVPLFFACLWVFVFPFLSRQILVFDKTQRFLTTRAILKAEEKKPIPDDEAMRLHVRLKDLRESWDKERMLLLKTIESLREQMQALSGDVADFESKVSSLASESSKVSQELSELQSSPSFDVAPHGVQLVARGLPEDRSPGHVTFHGQHVVWPWTVDVSKQKDLPNSIVANLKDAVLNESMLVVLHAVRDDDKFTAQSIASRIRLEPFEAKVAIDELSALGLAHGPMGRGDQYSITSAGRMTLAWLLRKGFRFEHDEVPF